MKKMALVVTVVALALLVSFNAQAQKMGASVGAEILIPMGDFSNVAKIGFGGTAQFDYMVNPDIAVTGKVGYITWGANTGDQLAGAKVEASWSAIPILFGGKYYFMPQGKARVYGQFELGLYMISVSSKVEVPFFGTQETSASSTEFAIAPAVGVELPVGPKGAVDVSARFLMIMTSGSASNNIGFRAGYKMFF